MSSEEENELSPGEMELEAALGGLKPAAAGFSLLAVRVRAAVRSERRRTRVWQCVAAVLAVAAGVGVWMKPVRTIEVEKVVIRDAQSPLDIRRVGEQVTPLRPPVVLVKGDFGYLHLRDKVLSRGVESLRSAPETPGAGRSPSIIGDGRPGQETSSPWYVDYLVSGGRS